MPRSLSVAIRRLADIYTQACPAIATALLLLVGGSVLSVAIMGWRDWSSFATNAATYGWAAAISTFLAVVVALRTASAQRREETRRHRDAAKWICHSIHARLGLYHGLTKASFQSMERILCKAWSDEHKQDRLLQARTNLHQVMQYLETLDLYSMRYAEPAAASHLQLATDLIRFALIATDENFVPGTRKALANKDVIQFSLFEALKLTQVHRQKVMFQPFDNETMVRQSILVREANEREQAAVEAEVADLYPLGTRPESGQ